MFKCAKATLCIAVVACLAGALPAAANNTQTINTSDAYVDLSIAAAFTTIPNLCTETVGSQNLTTTACNALGMAAVEAANGSGVSTDQYFEDASVNAPYSAKNAFVPNGSYVSNWEYAGYMPIFSQHKYDLFGRGSEKMGPLSREEILFVMAVGNFTEPVTQTQPGDNLIWDALTVLMIEPATYPAGHPLVLSGAVNVGDPLTKYSPEGSLWFDIANLGFYTDVTSINTGGKALANTFCQSYIDDQFGIPPALSPSSGAILVCNGMSAAVKANIYLENNFAAGIPNLCAGTASPVLANNNCNLRDQWVDQLVVGYIESFDDPAVQANSNFTQNFRSQMNFGIPLSSKITLTDFRLEQAALLGGNAFEGSRQTFQEVIANASVSGPAPQSSSTMSQLVTQDVQGWFSSCFNCDSSLNSVSHAFTPRDLGLSFMPYTNTWRDLPSISHGASGGNLTSFAQMPGNPGP